MARKIKLVTDFKNDVLFKYLFNNDKDEDSLYILGLIIKGLTGIEPKKIHVMNPEINPQQVEDKNMILDLRITDEHDREFDIEMQNSSLSQAQHQRFQIYGSSMIAKQEKVGGDYVTDVHEACQIIFVDDRNSYNHKIMYEKYKSRNEKGQIEPYNLLTRLFVYLPSINDKVKEKGIKNLSELEKTIYIFKNGINDDILKLESKVVNIMNEKMKKFNEDELLRDAALKRDLKRQADKREKKEFFENGKREGLIEGSFETKKEYVMKMFISLYPKHDTDFLENLTVEQYDTLHDMLFARQTLAEIKEYLKR